jgi:gamma-glutamyl-gamma-aminobutyrate hydrolase PuuD
MEDWGIQTHPNATPVQKRRQEFELSLLRALQQHSDVPVLGVCLGMQWMGLLAGGILNQDLEEPFSSNHTKCTHVVSGSIGEGIVHSHHHQAIEDPGCMEVVGSSTDGVIEAIQDTSRYWYKGVQWHPERTQDKMLGQHLFDDIVIACKKFSS